MKLKSQICDAKALNRAISRIAHETVERNENINDIILVGIKTRGVPFAERLSDFIYDKIDNSKKIPVGILDITFYRDDLEHIKEMPVVSGSDIKENINGKTVILPRGIAAAREYDKIALHKKTDGDAPTESIPFKMGAFTINGSTVEIKLYDADDTIDLKTGLYADFDKIPDKAVIRRRKTGDKFTKFGGGTKSLSDFLTDKKIPKKDRDNLILVADKDEVLAIFGLAVSDKVKINENTKKIIKFI